MNILARKNSWGNRRLFNCWRRPFPYLFHPWEIVMAYDETPGQYTNWCMSGRKHAVGRWVREWNDLEWEEFWEEFPDGADYDPATSPRSVSVPWVVHTDINKAHRCPVCCTGAGVWEEIEQHGYPRRNRHVFTCTRCGQRFTDRWWLPGYPGNGDGYKNRMMTVVWWNRWYRWQFYRLADKRKHGNGAV